MDHSYNCRVSWQYHGSFQQSINNWKTNLYTDGKLLWSVPIRRGIFQIHSFSPLKIVIALLSLTHILTETGIEYQIEKIEAKFNHQFILDYLNLYGKNDKEINSLIKAVWHCRKDIKIEFGILKCALVLL